MSDKHTTAFACNLNNETSGMSLRDYAAIHSTQPGVSEIVAVAGLHWRGGMVWRSRDDVIGVFETWWESLPLKERLSLCARVRYEQADAMLKERAK